MGLHKMCTALRHLYSNHLGPSICQPSLRTTVSKDPIHGTERRFCHRSSTAGVLEHGHILQYESIDLQERHLEIQGQEPTKGLSGA